MKCEQVLKRVVGGCLWLALSAVAWGDEPTKFEPGPDTEKADIKFLTPEESLKALKLPEGFTATMFAHEPDVRNPIGIATDERGRLWVAENYTYSESSLGWNDKLKDRIIILEDTNNDGVADKRKVFWDKGRRLTSVEIGYGGIWVLDAPKLLFIPDKNRDDVPDGEPIVMLDGWNDSAIRHNIVNGLRWGPDGWLYGRHGILQTSFVGRPGATADQRTPVNVGAWRFHPTRHTFEMVCNGTTNPWGMDWDENGELFFINTVIGHLWHAIPGAYLRRMYGEHLNPNVYQSIEQTADHFHWDTVENWSDIRKLGVTPTTDKAGGGHAHSGLAYVASDTNWPTEYVGSVLTVNLHGHRLNRDTIVREGATYVGKHAPDFASTSDPYFRAVDLLFGRRGELYIADWSDVGECHENDGVHRSSGRIFQVRYSSANSRDSFAKNSGNGLAKHRQVMEHILKTQSSNVADSELIKARAKQEQAGFTKSLQSLESLIQELKSNSELTEEDKKAIRRNLPNRWAGILQSLTIMHATGFADEAFLITLQSSPHENVRVTAGRLLFENSSLSDAAVRGLAERAASDSSGLMLTYIASGLQKLPHEKRWPIAKGLAAHGDLANDRVFPLMLWYGIEAAVPAQPAEAVKLAGQTKIPLIREFITRRLTSNIERAPEPVAELVKLLTSKDANDTSKIEILKGISVGLKGWRKAPAPANWKPTSDQLAKLGNAEIEQLTRELSLVFGDGRAMDELRKIAENNNATTDERRAALKALVVARADKLVPLLQNLVGNRELVVDAVRGLAAFDNPETSGLLVARYKGLQTQAKLEIISTLVSRPTFARVLLSAVKDEKIPRGEVSAFQLRQMQNLGDPAISDEVKKLWPELEQQSKEKAELIAALRTKLTPETLAKGDASQGRLLFSKSCANCHTLFGEGKKIAPDLTGAQRVNLNYLLENIIDPSATVSENFRMTVFVLEDGRVLNGVTVERSDKTFTVQTATDRITIQKDEIEQQRDSKLSMMPENLLGLLKEEQIRDLIAYLQSPSQVPLP